MLLGRVWRKSVSVTLVWALISSNFAYAGVTTETRANWLGKEKEVTVFEPEFEGQEYEGLKWFHNAVSEAVPGVDETNMAKLARYDLLGTLKTQYDFYQRAMVHFERLYKEYGHEKFMIKLDKNQIEYEEPGHAKMEFTLIDGKPLARTVHEESGVSILFAEKASIDPGSEHMQQFMSRQHFDAGRTREINKYEQDGATKKVRAGRDSILVWVEKDKDFDSVDYTLFARQKPLTKAWWTEWWKATYKKPDKYNFITGITFGLFQMATGYLLSGLVIGAHPTPEATQMLHAAGMLNLVFGTTIGIFSSTYANWTRRGDTFWRAVKSSTVSLAFAMSLRFLGPDGFSSLNVFDPSLGVVPYLQWANLAQNIMANNLLKTAWNQWSTVRSEARVDTHRWSLMFPKKVHKGSDGEIELEYYQWQTPIKRSDINRQIFSYVPVNFTRLMDQLLFTIYITEASQNWSVPLMSMALLWAFVPVSYWWNNYMASRDFPKQAKVIGTKKAWDFYSGMVPDQVWQGIRTINPKLEKDIKGEFDFNNPGRIVRTGRWIKEQFATVSTKALSIFAKPDQLPIVFEPSCDSLLKPDHPPDDIQ